MAVTLYLVRHAQALGNVKGTFQGSTDAPLSDYGRQQLETLAEEFKDIPIDRIYTSPLIRTRDTALAVNRYHQAPLYFRTALMEINCGEWEGKRWDDLRSDPDYPAWDKTPHLFWARGGERMASVYARMNHAFDSIVRVNPGKTVVIVSHGCALRNLMCRVHGLPFQRLNETPWMEHAGITKLRVEDDGKITILSENIRQWPQ